MSQQVSIQTALCLPAPDIEALIQGQMIVAMPRIFINPGRQFALYPSDIFNNVLPPEQYYHSRLLPTIQNNLAELGNEAVFIKAWARCEFCQDLDETVSLESLSKLTIWTIDGLQETLWQRQFIRLAYLRVYLLSQPLEIPANKQDKFVALPQSISVTEANPILSDRLFAQRQRQLKHLQPPLHPELADLQSALAKLANTSLAATQLNQNLKMLLGWSSDNLTWQLSPNLAWINDIVDLGDRSQELDNKKSNYQAGTDFENIVRRSLEFLGFIVDQAYKGGAGGLDLFCSKPYPLVGECKAGKAIPSRTAEELIKLGGMRLSEKQFKQASKLIIGPGKPSKDVLTAANKFKISIITPMSLQKLVELEAKYPGSVNLIELKNYLEPGQIDSKIEQYVETVWQELKWRSHIVELVKTYLENSGMERASVHALHGAYVTSRPPQPILPQEMHEILVELSSPLTGYLGRIKGETWGHDRFYFLRDLQIV